MKTKTPRSPRRIAAGLCGFIALEPVQYSHTHDRNRHPELVEGTCGCYRYRGLEENCHPELVEGTCGCYRYRGLEENRHHELVEATCGCYRYHGLEENCHPERVIQISYHTVFIVDTVQNFGCVGIVQGNSRFL
jgi:hypothetical protein